MIEPILQAKTTDTVDYSSNRNQRNALNSEGSTQQVSNQKNDNNALKNETNLERNNLQNNQEKPENKVGFADISENLNLMTNMPQTYFQFEIDEEQKGLILKIFDKETNEIIQQFPSELSLKIAQMIEENFGQGQIANAIV